MVFGYKLVINIMRYTEFYMRISNFTFFLDLPGLPVQVRDTALKLQDNMPKSDVNKEYYTQNMEREVVVYHIVCEQ